MRYTLWMNQDHEAYTLVHAAKVGILAGIDMEWHRRISTQSVDTESAIYPNIQINVRGEMVAYT